MLSTYMFSEYQPQTRRNKPILRLRGGTLQMRQAIYARPRKLFGPYTDYRNI